MALACLACGGSYGLECSHWSIRRGVIKTAVAGCNRSCYNTWEIQCSCGVRAVRKWTASAVDTYVCTNCKQTLLYSSSAKALVLVPS